MPPLRNAHQADEELNKTYGRLLSRYANDPGKLTRFKIAQRAWLAFRDAEVEARFGESDREQHGSVLPMCRCIELAQITVERTKELKAILDNPEGDVCGE